MPRSMSLTPELIALVERIVPEIGPEPGLTPLADDEYRRLVHEIMRNADGPLHVFAYGSLIWKPQVGFQPLRKVRAYGWRRTFSLNLTTFRGTPDQPGLMLALDYGGCCDGILMRADENIGPERIEDLLRREIDYAEDVPYIRWIKLRSGDETMTALTFYAAPRGNGVSIDLPLQEQAVRIAMAAGSAGSCAAYLHNTVVKLMQHGIDDGYLWKLQALVAQEIRTLYTTSRPSST